MLLLPSLVALGVKSSLLFDTNKRVKEILDKKQISYESNFFELFKYFDDDNAIQIELLNIIKQYDKDFNKTFESKFNNK